MEFIIHHLDPTAAHATTSVAFFLALFCLQAFVAGSTIASMRGARAYKPSGRIMSISTLIMAFVTMVMIKVFVFARYEFGLKIAGNGEAIVDFTVWMPYAGIIVACLFGLIGAGVTKLYTGRRPLKTA